MYLMGIFYASQKLHLDCNEIGARGGLELANAVRNKEKLTPLDVDGRLKALGSLR